jgi:PAS domain S-box-containing protein
MLDRETPLLFHCPEELAARATELTKQLGEPIEPDFRVLTLLALRNGDEDTRQWTLRRCDGQAVIVLLSITVLRDSEGQPHGILGNLADITALRQATEALRWERDRAQRYLETVHSLVILLDVDGRITLVNPFACELLGYSQHELVGNGWLEVCVSGQERERLSRLFDRARRQFKRLLSDIPEAPECDYIETLVRCADGSERLIGWHSNLFADEGGRVVGILCAGSDMTERHAMESARAAALQEAERLADLKNAFLTNMSHEIRTPLHAILGLAQIGRRDFASEDAGPLFRRIQQSGRHLLALLNDVLDVSRMDAGKVAIHAQPFRLADHIAELKSMIRPAVSAKGLALSIDCTSDLPEWVEGDALRLHQILINLLGNAVKFTPRGEISLKVAASAERIVFSVSDPGIGMTREQMTHIFQPFEQADIGSARVHGGTGLGLAISNNLAQLMGGQLSVESEQGLGSTFELSLPLPEVVAPPEAEDSAKMSAVEDTAMGEGQRLKGLHILAVDDVEVNLMVIEDLLTHEGARLTTASHGHQALVRVYESEDNPFDLVLMDVQMPVMDGYEATRRIRSLAPNLPIIGLTAHAFPEERDRCLEAGMSAHLSKPVDIDLLVQTLRFWRSRGGVSERHAGRIMDVSAAAGQLPEAGLGALTNEPSVTLTGQIDWTGLNRRFATSPGLVARLAQAAVESEAGTAQQLRAMAASGDLDGFFHKTHALKGLAANFCAETLREQAHQCCEQARGGDADALKGAEALAQGLEALLAELAETQAAGCSVQVSAEEPSQKSIRLSRNSSQRM